MYGYLFLYQSSKHDRGSRRKREIIERHKWRDNTILQRNILPGPGEYHNNKTDMANNAKGARWGKYKPKSITGMEILVVPGGGKNALMT